MTETYLHIFKSKNKLKITVDYSEENIQIFAGKVEEIDYLEYIEFVSQIFVPSVHNRCDGKQLENLANYGIKFLKV